MPRPCSPPTRPPVVSPRFGSRQSLPRRRRRVRRYDKMYGDRAGSNDACACTRQRRRARNLRALCRRRRRDLGRTAAAPRAPGRRIRRHCAPGRSIFEQCAVKLRAELDAASTPMTQLYLLPRPALGSSHVALRNGHFCGVCAGTTSISSKHQSYRFRRSLEIVFSGKPHDTCERV